MLQSSLDQCSQGTRGQTGATLIPRPLPPALFPVFALASILSKIYKLFCLLDIIDLLYFIFLYVSLFFNAFYRFSTMCDVFFCERTISF